MTILVVEDEPKVLDMWLKGRLNGITVLRASRKCVPAPAVIVITGFEEIPKEEVLKLGAAGFLKKPIRLDELDQLVAQVRQPPATP